MTTEQVLVIPKKELLKDSEIPTLENLITVINNSAIFYDREKAEKDENYLQIIPYVVVRWLKVNEYNEIDNEDYFANDFIFTYKRLPKGTESRLSGKMSIGVGGHINPIDVSNKPNFGTVEMSAIRELSEEISIEDHKFENEALSLAPMGPIYDPSNEVGRVHIGICFHYESPSSKVSAKETTKISGSLISLKDLATQFEKAKDNFETWSSIALESLV